MALAASGVLSLPLDAMRSIVSRSGAWQTWCGVSTAEAALAFVHLLDEPATSTAPLAILDVGDSWRRVRALCGQGAWDSTGTLMLYLRDQAATTDTEDDGLMRFHNRLGDVLWDLEQLATTDDFLLVEYEIKGTARTPRKMRKAHGDWFEAVTLLSVQESR